jgi:hypothetical protein
MLSVLTILTCIAFAVPAFAGIVMTADDYYMAVGKYDSLSNGFHTLPLDDNGNGYVAHVGDIVSAGVFTKGSIGYDFSDRVSGPFSIVDDSSGYKMVFTKVPGTPGVRCDSTGIAVYSACVFVAWPFDSRSCPLNLGLSTTLRVIPLLPLKATTYAAKVSTGYLVACYLTNVGTTMISAPDLVYTIASSGMTATGIRWKFSASGLAGPFDFVDQPLSFTYSSIAQCWVKGAGSSTWMRYDVGGQKVAPGQLWGLGNLMPGQTVGVQLILKPTN